MAVLFYVYCDENAMEGSGRVARIIREAEIPDLGNNFLPCRKLFKTEGFEGAKRRVLVSSKNERSLGKGTLIKKQQRLMLLFFIEP